jgi:hypothetical protein
MYSLEKKINYLNEKFPKLEIIEYNKDSKLFTFKCKEHGEFKKYYKQIMGSKHGCNDCAKHFAWERSYAAICKKYGKGGALGNNKCREKGKITKLERYGDENYSNREQGLITFQNKSDEEKRALKEKTKNTCLKKYGVQNAFQLKKSRENNKISLQRQEVKDKRKQTNIKKYGAENCLSLNSSLRAGINKKLQDNAQDRIKKTIRTCIERYGTTTWTASEQGRKVLSEKGKDLNVIKKRVETAKARGTLRSSRQENYFAELLDLHNIKYECEYISDEYPFKCDFYLVDTKTYVELNFHWTHNDHWFDASDENDKALLEFYKRKHKKFYDNAIYVWTTRDIQKRDAALKNKLNYVVLWNISEIEPFIKNYIKQTCID